MALEGWRRLLADVVGRLGLGRLLPGLDDGARFYNCGRQGARSWWERTDVAVELVAQALQGKSARARVLDFGCGDEKVGAELARRGLDVDYAGFDLHPQSPRVRQLDLARDAIDDRADVAVVLGVFEYLEDPVAVMRRIAAAAPVLVVSHAASDLGRAADFDPKSLHWVLYVDRATFERHLASAGFRVEQRRVTPDGKTALWLCRRDEVVSGEI